VRALIRETIEACGVAAGEHAASAATYQFGEFAIRLRMQAQGQMDALLKSIRHCRVDSASPTAVIDVFGGAQPRLEHLLPPEERRGERFLYDHAQAYMLWTAEGCLTLFDRQSRRGIVWYVTPDSIPSWEVGRPFLPLIKALSIATAWTPVQAAAVARGRAGVLILGASRAGKSSTALACVDAGWRYVGDDCVLLTGQPPRAASLFQTARVRADMVSRLQITKTAIERYSEDSGELRAEINVAQFEGVDIGDAHIKAIVLPQRNGAHRATLAPMSRSHALRVLSAPTLAMLPGAPVATHNILADIVQQVSCYTIDPGRDIAAIPEMLAKLI
jgi:hypothetical protein